MTTLPPRFLQQVVEPYAELAHLPQALQQAPTVAVRLNRRKPISTAGLEGEPVPWCPQGIYLDQRPDFTLDPCLHQGAYYVMDASSMFIAHAIASLELDSPVTYLDACAAPGGKALCAADALPEGSLVVANEIMPLRAEILRENCIKWGAEGKIVTRGDTRPLSRLASAFSIVAADVPCSGEGMMRKDAEAVAQWSPALVAECAARQREIVTNLWPALCAGGVFIYSTCTFNTIENEDMVQWIVDTFDAEPIEVPIDPAWGITDAIKGNLPAYRFLPGRTRGEGLFMALLRKPGCGRPRPDNLARRLAKETRVIMDGVEGWETKGRDRVPTHALAMSGDACGQFPQVELDIDSALAYLRRDTPSLPCDTPRGYVLLTYGGLPLGFVKNIGNRCNSLYPAEWRIRNK